MRKIVSREIVDDVVTSVTSSKGTTSYWLEKIVYSDGTSETIVREEVTFGYRPVRGQFRVLDLGKKH
jgi:hypothetical protein